MGEHSRSRRDEVVVDVGSDVPAAPAVSVVIPAFCAPWLEEALESVRAQTFRRHEIIVVDDGSPEPIQPARTSDLVLVRQPNAGPGGARNRGVLVARAPLVAFLDSDDRWRPEKLAHQLALHARRPDLVAPCTDVAVLGAPHATTRALHPTGDLISFEQLFHENCVGTSTVIVSRAAWLRTPGMPQGRMLGEDHLEWLRRALRGPFGHLAEPLTERRRHEDSLSETRLRDGRWISEERSVYDQFLREHPELRGQPLVRRMLARLEFQSGWFHLQQADFSRDRGAFVRSLLYRPVRAKGWLNLARSLAKLFPRPRSSAALDDHDLTLAARQKRDLGDPLDVQRRAVEIGL